MTNAEGKQGRTRDQGNRICMADREKEVGGEGKEVQDGQKRNFGGKDLSLVPENSITI